MRRLDNMKQIIALIAMIITTGCAGIKTAADAGIVVLQFPECRMELERYLPDSVEAELVIEWESIDSTFNKIIEAASGNLDMSLDTAIRLARVSATADMIESDFMRIVDRTLEYKQFSGRDTSQFLKDCNTTTQAGWKGVRENEGVATVGDFLKAAAPYAKLVPLILMEKSTMRRLASAG